MITHFHKFRRILYFETGNDKNICNEKFKEFNYEKKKKNSPTLSFHFLLQSNHFVNQNTGFIKHSGKNP